MYIERPDQLPSRANPFVGFGILLGSAFLASFLRDGLETFLGPVQLRSNWVIVLLFGLFTVAGDLAFRWRRGRGMSNARFTVAACGGSLYYIPIWIWGALAVCGAVAMWASS